MDSKTHHKILLLDDDPDLLDMYREILSQLPSKPDVRTSSSGPRAMAMLESDTFRLLICDLKMPKMDGLQVLSIVRRKHPELRTVVLTSVADEQFRSRVYALGVDLFWQKPATEQEIRLFSDCIESLLGRGGIEPGFRGVHSKSLVDIIQLECISQSSSVLRITNGPLIGKIWITNGELVDAETEGATGEPAFKKILAWRAGSFETMAADPEHPRKILNSYNALLLETAQEIDELLGEEAKALTEGKPAKAVSRLAPLAQVEGVEFVLSAAAASVDGTKLRVESRGLENPEKLGAWTRKTIDKFRNVGERLHAGPLEQITGLGMQRNVGLARLSDADICVGWNHALGLDEIRARMKKTLALWGF